MNDDPPVRAVKRAPESDRSGRIGSPALGKCDGETPYRALFDSIDEGFCIIEVLFDAAGRAIDYVFLDVNAVFEAQTGLADPVGKSMRQMRPDHEEHWFETYGRIALSGEPERLVHRAAALDRWYNVYAFRIDRPEDRHVAILFQDISEERRVQEALRENEQRLATELSGSRLLQRLSTRLIPEQSPDALYEEILDTALELMRADAVSIQLLEEDGKRLRRVATRNLHPDSTEYWTWVDASHASTCGLALARNERVMLEDVETTPELAGTGDLEAFRASGTRAVQSSPLLTRTGRPIGMISTHWHAPRRFHESDFGLFDILARQVADLFERSRTGTALRGSEERYRLIVENARYAAIFTTDPDGMVTDWHEGAETAFGYARDEIIGRDSRILWTAEDRAALQPEEEFGTAAETGKAPNVRWHLRKDGGRVFIDGVVTALHDAAGRLTGFLKVGLDATERRRADEHQKMLHAELQHRVRNTLAIVRSIVRRTAATSGSVDEFERHLDGRIGAFARTQAYVTRDPDAGVDLELLVRDELLAHAANGQQGVTIDGPKVRLAPKHAETIGLAIHELTSNAVRHGALASEGNRIDVSWSIGGQVDGRQLHFTWREHLADRRLSQPARAGFGTELLERVIGYELDAEPSIEFAPEGVVYEVTIPLPGKASSS